MPTPYRVPNNSRLTTGLFDQFVQFPIPRGPKSTRAQRALSVRTAINQAISSGCSFVMVPSDYWDYADSSVLTFDRGVRMIREGQIVDGYDVLAYGAASDGSTDDWFAVQSAISHAEQNGGGVVVIPSDKTVSVSSMLNLSNFSGGITITGARDSESLARLIPETPNLLYTGSHQTFIALASAQRVTIEKLAIRYSNSSFTGNLIDLNTTGGDSAYIRIKDCQLGGTVSNISGAKSCIRLEHGIIGVDGGYANVIQLKGNTYKSTNSFAVYNAGQAWSLIGETFEPASQSGGTYVRALGYGDDANGSSKGLTFLGCWFGDVSHGTDAWIQFKGYGLNVIGCYFGHNSPNAGAISLKNNAQGVTIQGNRFETTYGVRAEAVYAYGVNLFGNSYQAVSSAISNPGNFYNLDTTGEHDLPRYKTHGFALAIDGTLSVDTTNDKLGFGAITSIATNSGGGYLARMGVTGYPTGTLGVIAPSSLAADIALIAGSPTPQHNFNVGADGWVTSTSSATLGMRRKNTPASGTAAGVQGDFAFDNSYLYIAHSTDSWSRLTLNRF